MGVIRRTVPRYPSGQRAAPAHREPGPAYPHHSPRTGSYNVVIFNMRFRDFRATCWRRRIALPGLSRAS